MRLLFVHQYLGALGGAETDVLLTAGKLRHRRHEVNLLHVESTGADEQNWWRAFGRCLPAPASGPSARPHLAALLEKLRPEVIYLNSLSRLDLLEGLVESGLPIIRRVHDHQMYCMRGYKYNYFTRAICTRPASGRCLFPCLAFLGRNPAGGFPVRWVSYADKKKEIQLNRQCRRFIVYSQHQKTELVRNGFDAAKIDIHVPIRCWGAAGPVSPLDSRNLVLFAGQIIRGKGVDLLLRTLPRLRVPFQCAIVGDGNHRAYCERLCRRLGLGDRVKFHGFVPHQRIHEYFLQASVLVIPSVWPEPFALVGQEAARYGLPVVAFDSGGISEWLHDGENGFVVPWMDTRRLAERIEQVLRDKPLARALGQRGMEKVNHHYDAGRQISSLEEIFRQVRQDAGPAFPSPETPSLPPNAAPAGALHSAASDSIGQEGDDRYE